jgi:CubicO group peptidase (beta-lactamase class C family)
LTRCLESAAKLPGSSASIGEVFCREARELDVTGAAMAVAEPGGPPSTIFYGRRCSNARERVDAQTHFAIASLTKAAAALVVLDLLDEHHRPLSAALDDRPGSVAVLHLLRHSAGVRPDGTAASREPGDKAPPPSTWFEPGELWHYDNANYQRLQRDISELGWPLDAAWSRRFDEGGPRFAARPKGACDHTWVEGHPVPLPPNADTAAQPELAGGARASVDEVLELLAQVAADPRMIESTTPTAEGDHYGLGLRVATAAGGDRKTWWHTGAGIGSWAWMRGDSEGRRAVILGNRNIALPETVTAIERALFETDPIEAPKRPSAELIRGEYRVRDWDQPVTIRQEQARLLLDAPTMGTTGVELQPDGRWGFRAHLPMQAGSQTLLFVESKGQIWLRSPWFVARKTDPT